MLLGEPLTLRYSMVTVVLLIGGTYIPTRAGYQYCFHALINPSFSLNTAVTALSLYYAISVRAARGNLALKSNTPGVGG